VDLTTNPERNQFTMRWRSVEGATYSVFGWDRQARSFEEVAKVTATGETAFVSRLMEEEGIFFVLLTSAPPPP